MAMAEEEFDQEEFDEWVKQGLKISHGMNLDQLDEENLPSFYPTAPVAFAFVTDLDAIDAEADPVAMAMAGEISLPAMIPLPLNKFSVSGAYLGPNSNSVNVRLRASWTLRFVKPQSSSHFALALPIPSHPPYSHGFLSYFRFKVSNSSSQPAAPPYSTKQPMFGNLHFIWLDSVNGGAQVSVDLSYLVNYSYLRSWTISLSFATRLPFYAYGIRGERNGDSNGTNRKLKLRLCLIVEKDQKIEKPAINFPLKVITEEKSTWMLLHESEGPHVEWPDHDLRCTFHIAHAEAAKTNQTTQTQEPEAAKTKQATQTLEPEATETNQTTHESLEPQSKKIRLTN